MTNEKELREEFENKFNLMEGTIDDEFRVDITELVADWWLSKLHSHTKEVVEKIEKLPRYDVYDGGKAEIEDGDYIKVSDILASLQDNK